MKDIFLHGSLAQQFGDCFRLDVRDPREAVHAIAIQVPGFRDAIEAGNWHIFRGPLDDGQDIDEEGVDMALGSADEMHLIPAAEGAGIGAAIIGAALIGGSFLASTAIASTLLAVGVGLMLGGVAQMLMSPPAADYDSRERPDERPSFIFDGATNTSTQGLPVPLIYGRMRTGSIVVSAGLTAEDIPINSTAGESGATLVDLGQP